MAVANKLFTRFAARGRCWNRMSWRTRISGYGNGRKNRSRKEKLHRLRPWVLRASFVHRSISAVGKVCRCLLEESVVLWYGWIWKFALESKWLPPSPRNVLVVAYNSANRERRSSSSLSCYPSLYTWLRLSSATSAITMYRSAIKIAVVLVGVPRKFALESKWPP